MKRLACLLLISMLPGCAAFKKVFRPEKYAAEQREVAEANSSVRVVKSTPDTCKHLGQVNANDSGRGGLVRGSERSTSAALSQLKVRAARLGADTVEIIDTGDGWYLGEAYQCGKSS
jgi:hypothetical protein